TCRFYILKHVEMLCRERFKEIAMRRVNMKLTKRNMEIICQVLKSWMISTNSTEIYTTPYLLETLLYYRTVCGYAYCLRYLSHQHVHRGPNINSFSCALW
ncbi:hypothetical protein L9F63_024824, partial [Diploptera punctata]